jgi:hypothetical protein
MGRGSDLVFQAAVFIRDDIKNLLQPKRFDAVSAEDSLVF